MSREQIAVEALRYMVDELEGMPQALAAVGAPLAAVYVNKIRERGRTALLQLGQRDGVRD